MHLGILYVPPTVHFTIDEILSSRLDVIQSLIPIASCQAADMSLASELFQWYATTSGTHFYTTSAIILTTKSFSLHFYGDPLLTS